MRGGGRLLLVFAVLALLLPMASAGCCGEVGCLIDSEWFSNGECESSSIVGLGPFLRISAMNASAHLNAVWACDTSACDSCNGSQVDFSSGNGVCAPVAGTQNSIRINFFRTVLDIPVQLSLFNGTTKFDYECYRDLGLNTSTGNVNTTSGKCASIPGFGYGYFAILATLEKSQLSQVGYYCDATCSQCDSRNGGIDITTFCQKADVKYAANGTLQFALGLDPLHPLDSRAVAARLCALIFFLALAAVLL